MRRVYLSFLGLGSGRPPDYHPAIYHINGRNSSETKFVQSAEIEIIGADAFDVVLIAVTPQSFDRHFETLASQLADLGVKPVQIDISDDMSPETQWKWFERILSHIEREDVLTVDMTHGFRAVPILFSSAINFLQRARNISIHAVYYGVFDRKDENGYVPIVDMKDFYLINEWADGVSRLIEDADARKLAKVAEQTAGFQAGELNDTRLIGALQTLTSTIRNVDIHNVGSKVNDAIRLVEQKKKGASETARILLDLVLDKFVSLSTTEPPTGRYDGGYFKLQIEIIRLLLEHKLYMQAYTVMREFIASIGMIEVEKAGIFNKKGRNRRKMFGEKFVNMGQYEESEWKFGEKAARKNDRPINEDDSAWDQLLPYYRKLEQIQVIDTLRSFVKDLVAYRNGFDHAWTLKANADTDIESKGKDFLDRLEETVRLLESGGVL